ncbi:unnamed protein product [Caenorhabditis bovis]|uniref:DUF423 domain-containing protein n=1 Tax=Caenorhabditis bovis TaxID=2654633 RepID=A0A8S1F382_9PELO|nr:unnamed protein product [Caenorhabditis bovis]
MSQLLIDATTSLLNYVPLINQYLPVASSQKPSIGEMSHLVRLAGVSGALAISLGAYGSHVLRDSPNASDRRKTAFETGNRYHLIHSLALLASSKARYPRVTATLLATGMLLFSGPCYHYAITGKEDVRKFTPIGGVTLILAWLSFVL